MSAEAHIASPAFPCHHKMAADEVANSQQLMTQLQYLMLLDDWPEPAGALLEQALRSSGAALSMLRSCFCGRREVAAVESSSGGGPEGKFLAGGKRENPWVEVMSAEALKKRKSLEITWVTVTTAPHFDGYQWRKYGQKLTSNSKYPRSYYRCTNFRDQGCVATKTVQRKDDKNVAEFVVAYKMQHSCSSTEAEVVSHAFVVESAHQ